MRKDFSLDDAAEKTSVLDTSPANGQVLLNAAAATPGWTGAAVSLPDVDATAIATFADALLHNDDMRGWMESFNRSSFVGDAGDNSLTGGNGNDYLYGNDGNDTLTGGNGFDYLYGNNGNDRLVDVFDGSYGAVMVGGAGNDTYWIFAGFDYTVIENDAEGIDEIGVVDRNSITLFDNVEILRMSGASFTGRGNALDNKIIGGTRDNSLFGEEGNDSLIGGEGADTMEGGIGDDTYVVEPDGDVIVEDINAGTDLVRTTGSFDYTLSANVENLIMGGAGIGRGNETNNHLTGSNSDDILVGFGGNDKLDGGGGGNDTLDGGQGNDSYYLNHTSVYMFEASGAGIDEVFTTLSLTLAANFENLNLVSGHIYGYGNGLANYIQGSTGDNTINGGDGNDTLIGGGGHDLFWGELGNDSMSGGTGNDTYHVEQAGDIVFEASGNGTDKVRADLATTYTLPDNVEILQLTGSGNGTGNAISNWLTGSHVANILSGLGGHDTLTGEEGNDTLAGGDGNDDLNGGTEVDSMSGGLGNDTYHVDSAGEVVDEAANAGIDDVFTTVTLALAANVENATLVIGGLGALGNSLANRLTGSSGNDQLLGQDGNDTLAGMEGNDTQLGGNGSDNLSGGDGSDVLDGGAGIDTFAGGLGNDTFVIDVTGEVISEAADAGLDEIYAAVTVFMGSNIENLTLLAGNLAGFGNDLANRLMGSTGDDYLSGQNGNDTAYGLGGNDTLIGDSGDDALDGGEGNDQLTGGLGTNQVYGGLGDDTVYAGDAVFGVTGGVLDGGDGNDWLDLSVNTAAISLNLATGANGFSATVTAFEHLNSGSGNDFIGGTDGNNVLAGNGGADTVLAGLGHDSVTGGDGNDWLDGGDGDNTIVGGAGNDTLIGTINGYNVVLDGGDGYDLADVSPYGGDYIIDMVTGETGFGGEAIINIEALVTAGGNDHIVGNAAANQISVNAGNDTVLAGAGADFVTGGDGMDQIFGEGDDDSLYGLDGDDELNGGAGHDAIYGGSGNDTVTVADGDDGFDTVDGEDGMDFLDASALTYDLSLTLVDGWTNVAASFAGFEGVMTGSGNDTIIGTAALDYIQTGGGNDWLNGGAGADILFGEAGNDVYFFTTGDLLIEMADGGTDGVYSADSISLSDNIENVFLTGVDAVNATGNAAANSLIGNANHNVLDGGGGADTLAGGSGDDSYYVDSTGDSVVEANSAGTDSLFSSVTYSLNGRYIEFLTLTGAANINATGNSLGQTLTGNSGNNSLTALGGNDRLDGGSGGADTLIGGIGDDTYVITTPGDTVTEAANEGSDLVESAITYTLAAEVERLTLTGSANISGTGNGLHNILIGNAGNNTLTGGDGNDTYYVQNAADHVSEASNAGLDTVISSVTYSLAGKQAEVLILTGSDNLNATGNGLLNVLTGNSGSNVLDGGAGHDSLDGGAGADSLIGGTGNDTYGVDNAGDTITELAGGGADLVNASVTYTLSADVEALTLTGAAAIDGTGNAGNNTLTGNGAKNVLAGGAGNDTYYIQTATDNVVELSGEGTDVIYSTVSYSLNGRYAETLILTGSAGVSATGNSLGNTLTGNDGINTINGKGGKDILAGGLGADVFLFEAASGLDTITDFNAAQNDVINVNAYTGGVANNGMLAQVGGNVVITLSAGNVITVNTALVADVLSHMVW
ncbi:hypothetical protein ABAC460_01280 [Asticcacaulis sp. AC460]|uniref:beta strand repeat-containing protein n=1 Tax=Asticcacaulis sp. AC460 TaxID=1282360 RepID=UPI0003C3F890|nr:calcium-binding protein [Asticcacaulis sp. AC460]ESQ92907.1 hypothetical protein ABAC460_01280 [Asticcacaulis sp. AC460]